MQTLDGHDCWSFVHGSYGSAGLNLTRQETPMTVTRQETSMTVLLSCITAADQRGQLVCINDSRLQVDSDQFTQAIHHCVLCSEMHCCLALVSLPACNFQPCMLCINCCRLKLDCVCGITVVFTFIACSEMIRSHGCGTHSAYLHLVAMHACKMCIN